MMNILQLYDLAVSELKPVTVGGFSGASVWHVTDRDGNEYCLKKWPLNGPDAEHLIWIHGVIHAVNNSVEIPLSPPVVSNSGLTVVTDEGHCWDLTEWLPGEAPADDISAEQVQALCMHLRSFISHRSPLSHQTEVPDHLECDPDLHIGWGRAVFLKLQIKWQVSLPTR